MAVRERRERRYESVAMIVVEKQYEVKVRIAERIPR